MIDGRSEDQKIRRSRVKCKFTTLLAQWLIKVYPGLVLGNRQPALPPPTRSVMPRCRSSNVSSDANAAACRASGNKAEYQLKAWTLKEPAGYNFILHTCTANPFPPTSVRPPDHQITCKYHKGYQFVFFTRIAIMSAMDMFWAAPPVARYATS